MAAARHPRYSELANQFLYLVPCCRVHLLVTRPSRASKFILLLLWSLQVIQYVDSLVPTVRRALIDPLPEVRVAAAKTFDQLHNTIGAKALDDILPDLLKKMVHVIN